MRASWHAIHAGLIRTTITLQFQRRFEALGRRVPEVARFPDPAALFDWLHAPNGVAEDRNAVLRALVAAAQTDGEPAITLLLVALWPGLDAVHRRLRPLFRHDPELLAAEVSARVIQNVATLDRASVTRIAATLVRNVERDIRRSLLRERTPARGPTPEELGGEAGVSSPLGVPSGLDADAEARVLVERLRPHAGPDAALVVAVAAQGARQHEAAAALGCTPAAARKRYQRALRRLQEEFGAAA